MAKEAIRYFQDAFVIIDGEKRHFSQLINNPGNLLYFPNLKWKGQIGYAEVKMKKSTMKFAVFNNQANGLRAQARTFLNKVETQLSKKVPGTWQDVIRMYDPAASEATVANYSAVLQKGANGRTLAEFLPSDLKNVLLAQHKFETLFDWLDEKMVSSGLDVYIDSYGKQISAIWQGDFSGVTALIKGASSEMIGDYLTSLDKIVDDSVDKITSAVESSNLIPPLLKSRIVKDIKTNSDVLRKTFIGYASESDLATNASSTFKGMFASYSKIE